MRRCLLYAAGAIVLLSAIATAYQLTSAGAASRPCSLCGAPMHVSLAAAGTYLFCNQCVRTEVAPASGGFSWTDAAEYFIDGSPPR
jgi:hypothetical protein